MCLVFREPGLRTNLASCLAPLSRIDITPDTPQNAASLAHPTTATPGRTSTSPHPPQDRPAPTTASPEPAPNTTTQPPAKRKRLTAAEKAAKADEEARKKKEREEARQQKLAEKARQEKEKQAAKAARQAEKAKREEAEQEAKAAKQQERDEKRRKKEEEERRVREEKEKKARSQPKLHSFLMKPTTPKKAAPAPAPNDAEGSPKVTGSAKKERTQYERMFQPFFVHEHVRVARTRPWLDDEAAGAKARILDEFVGGERGGTAVTPFRPLEALQVAAKPLRKGRAHPPVRGIIEELQQNPSALERLKRIPMKHICFRQDVRPPYYGTLTSAAHQLGGARLARAARRPNARVLELQYDYDSEAEWQDDEPGDDLDDIDDEEEDLDDEDDMDGFLDDSEDTGVARRLFANGMEPVSTGVCWEGGGVVPELKPYRMEVILGMSSRPSSPATKLTKAEGIDPSGGIDPTSTSYWSPRKKNTPTSANTAFDALKKDPEPKPQITRPELLPEFRKAVLANRKLSKLAIVEVLGVQFGGLSKAETRAMLEFVAERGHGKGKVWELREA